jgi:hypothetical protein
MNDSLLFIGSEMSSLLHPKKGFQSQKKLSLRAKRAWQSRFEIAEPVPSEARNLWVCFHHASQPLPLFAMTYRGNVNYFFGKKGFLVPPSLTSISEVV